MLSSAQSEKDVLLETTSSISLKKASRIQKFNNLLDQALAYIHLFDKEDGSNAFLETDKLLRVSGSNNQINTVFNKMMGRAKNLSGDPSMRPLQSFDKFVKDPNNVVGLIKYGLNEIKIYWPINVDEAFQAFVKDSSMDFNHFIQYLINKEALEEAKFFHNLLYLMHRIYHFHAKNNMHENEIVKAVASPLAHFSNNGFAFLSPKFSSEQIKQAELRLNEAIKNKFFEEIFFMRFPEANTLLLKQYKDDIQFPILTEPMKMLGDILPDWLSSFLLKHFFKENKKIEKIEQVEPIKTVEPEPKSAPPKPEPKPEPMPIPVKIFKPEPTIVIEPEPVKASHVKVATPAPVQVAEPVAVTSDQVKKEKSPAKAKTKPKPKSKAKSKELEEVVKKPPKDRLSQLQDKFIMMNRPVLKDKPKEK